MSGHLMTNIIKVFSGFVFYNYQKMNYSDTFVKKRTSYSGKVAAAFVLLWFLCLAFKIFLVQTHETTECYMENIQYYFFFFTSQILKLKLKTLHRLYNADEYYGDQWCFYRRFQRNCTYLAQHNMKGQASTRGILLHEALSLTLISCIL